MERHAFVRLMKIDREIRAKRYPNCRQLAEEFETSQRTILRDIESLRDQLGAPIEFSKEKNGYYYTSDEFSPSPLHLTEGELLAVFLGAELIKKYKNTPFEAVIEQAFKKIEILLPATVSVDLNDISQSYSFDIKQTRELDKKSAAVFTALAKAIKDKQSVEIIYYTISRNVTGKRIIDPYHLKHTHGAWYVVGYDHLRKDIRTFAVNQIRSIKLVKDKFEIQAGFSPEKFFEHSFGFEEGGPITKVAVKLDKEIARWFADRKFHPSQKTVENKDGSITLTFKVAGTDEIKRWVLSQGRYAKVMEPKELKEEIRDEARRMAGLQGVCSCAN